MLVQDRNWIKLETPPISTNLELLTSDYGTDGTFEDIFFDRCAGEIYRKRSWGESSVMKAGLVWFKFKLS